MLVFERKKTFSGWLSFKETHMFSTSAAPMTQEIMRKKFNALNHLDLLIISFSTQIKTLIHLKV